MQARGPRDNIARMPNRASSRVLAGLLVLLLAPALARAAEPAVKLVAPAPGTPLVGPVTVAFELTGLAAADIRGAAVLLDGKERAQLTVPPWRVTIDAGDELRERTLEVRVTLASGKVVAGRWVTAKPAVSEVEVRLVNLAVTVRDKDGHAAKDLQREEFTVFDAGQPVAIERWEATNSPLAVSIVLDTSLSMEGDSIAEAKRAVRSFVEKLDAKDEIMLLAFSDEVRQLVPLTSDRAAVLGAVDALVAAGGTALYDAMHDAATRLTHVPPGFRHVMVLLSDGRDEAASGLEPGSFHTLDEAIHTAHMADATVFTIGLGGELSTTDFTGRYRTAEILERLARTTGGEYHAVTSWRRLGTAFRTVVDELRQQYWIAYRPPVARPGETWRTVQVKVARPGFTTRTREGYFVD